MKTKLKHTTTASKNRLGNPAESHLFHHVHPPSAEKKKQEISTLAVSGLSYCFALFLDELNKLRSKSPAVSGTSQPVQVPVAFLTNTRH